MKATRYHLPKTDYFKVIGQAMPLDALAGYAEAERRSRIIGINLENRIPAPFSGPHEYSPYGAGIVERIREDPSQVNFLTGRWQRALVASPATAILGLGSATISLDEMIHAEMADVIMQGKAKFFSETAGVSATPLCIRSHLTLEQLNQLKDLGRHDPRARDEKARIWRALDFAETVKRIACNYGFINIEDAQGKDLPLIFGALECLKNECAIWSDDKQGTGVITAAAVLAWAELTSRKLENVRGIILGAGAGAVGVYEELVNHGVNPANILVTDSRGVLHEGRGDVESDQNKVTMRHGIPDGTSLEGFAKGADFVINLGVKEMLTDDILRTEEIARHLAPKPFFAPMTNPEPGIIPEMLFAVRPDAFYASGNQQYRNTVNNFTAFGYVGAGVLMAMAAGVGSMMTIAAARGIFEVAKRHPEFGPNRLVPNPRDVDLIVYEAGAVAKAAGRAGLSLRLGKRPTPPQLAQFEREIDELVAVRKRLIEEGREDQERRDRNLRVRFPSRYAPFTLPKGGEPNYHLAPDIPREEFEYFAKKMGVREQHWSELVMEDGKIDPRSLTTILEKLKPAALGESESSTIGAKELRIILEIAQICPSLGLALALRRTRVRDENLESRPTVFHRKAVLDTVLAVVPEARKRIYSVFEGIPESSFDAVG